MTNVKLTAPKNHHSSFCGYFNKKVICDIFKHSEQCLYERVPVLLATCTHASTHIHLLRHAGDTVHILAAGYKLYCCCVTDVGGNVPRTVAKEEEDASLPENGCNVNFYFRNMVRNMNTMSVCIRKEFTLLYTQTIHLLFWSEILNT